MIGVGVSQGQVDRNAADVSIRKNTDPMRKFVADGLTWTDWVRKLTDDD